MFKDIFWPFAALLIALVPTVLVLGWLHSPNYRDLVRRMFAGWGAILPVASYRMPFAFPLFAACWMIAMMLMASRAWAADTAPTAAFVVDWTPLVNKLIELAAVAMAAVLTAAAHRAAKTFQSMHVSNVTQGHMGDVEFLIGEGATWAAQQIEAIVDPHTKTQVKSAILAKAAQMVIDQAPVQMKAIGMTQAGIKGAIEMKLDPPNPVTATPTDAKTS